MLFTITTLLGAGLPVFGQGVLTGNIRDLNGRPLAGVEVLLDSSKSDTRSDSSGRYSLTAPAGAYVAVFRMLGYQPVRQRVRLGTDDTLTFNPTLAIGDAQQLAAVDVRGSRPRGVGREAFEDRRALGLGKFIDSTVLRRFEGRNLGELLREFGGVRIVPGGSGQLYAVNAIKSNIDGGPSCFMSIFIDGVLYYRSGSRDPVPDLRREFSVMSLEAVEYYRGSGQIPLEFSGRSADCGVIVLWTRRGR